MMSIEEFRELHTRMEAAKPKLFQLVPPDAPATEHDLAKVESSVGVRLPHSYRLFLREFGGGTFGLTNICSADPRGECYLPQKQQEVNSYLPASLLAVSDDHAGGLYVLKIEGGQAGEPLFYWNFDGGLQATEFASVLDFVARYAYNAA